MIATRMMCTILTLDLRAAASDLPLGIEPPPLSVISSCVRREEGDEQFKREANAS